MTAIDPDEYHKCPFEGCDKSYAYAGSLAKHVAKVHHEEVRSAGKAYRHPESKDLAPEDVVVPADKWEPQATMHFGAVEAMMRREDPNSIKTNELARNGSDLIRVIANRITAKTPGGLSIAEREDIAQQLLTMAHLLEALYKELKDVDLRKLQTKARRWDKVAAAVADSLAEEARGE